MNEKSELFDRAWRAEFKTLDVSGGKTVCFISLPILALSLIAWLLLKPSLIGNRSPEWVGMILCADFLVVSISYWMLSNGWNRWWGKYVMTVFQVSTITMLLWDDIAHTYEIGSDVSYNPLYFLGYALMIAMTAFRFDPANCIFSGCLAAGQFCLLNEWIVRPRVLMAAQTEYERAHWGGPFLLVSTATLVGIGLFAGLSARLLLKSTKRSVSEALRTASIERSIGRYLSPDVAKALISDPESLRPRICEVAVLFCDLRNFTSFSETRSAGEVALWLDNFYESASRLIDSEGGIVNKFLGDGFLAVFGAPRSHPDIYLASIQAARKLVDELDPQAARMGLSLGVGLHAGSVIAGEVGTGDRCEYTVIGETVNLAARIETLNKDFGSKILFSETIGSRLNASSTRTSRGLCSIRGLSHPVHIFELI